METVYVVEIIINPTRKILIAVVDLYPNKEEEEMDLENSIHRFLNTLSLQIALSIGDFVGLSSTADALVVFLLTLVLLFFVYAHGTIAFSERIHNLNWKKFLQNLLALSTLVLLFLSLDLWRRLLLVHVISPQLNAGAVVLAAFLIVVLGYVLLDTLSENQGEYSKGQSLVNRFTSPLALQIGIYIGRSVLAPVDFFQVLLFTLVAVFAVILYKGGMRLWKNKDSKWKHFVENAADFALLLVLFSTIELWKKTVTPPDPSSSGAIFSFVILGFLIFLLLYGIFYTWMAGTQPIGEIDRISESFLSSFSLQLVLFVESAADANPDDFILLLITLIVFFAVAIMAAIRQLVRGRENYWQTFVYFSTVFVISLLLLLLFSLWKEQLSSSIDPSDFFAWELLLLFGAGLAFGLVFLLTCFPAQTKQGVP